MFYLSLLPILLFPPLGVFIGVTFGHVGTSCSTIAFVLWWILMHRLSSRFAAYSVGVLWSLIWVMLATWSALLLTSVGVFL